MKIKVGGEYDFVTKTGRQPVLSGRVTELQEDGKVAMVSLTAPADVMVRANDPTPRQPGEMVSVHLDFVVPQA